jgi:hypothetical protein
MISIFPLWMLVVIWALQKRSAPRLSMVDAARLQRLLDDAVLMLPVPSTWWEEWLVTRVLTWIYKQQEYVSLMIRVNVIAVGKVRR